ncbi:hypothetical protein JQX08_17335 [Pseudomonas sp. UL073]|uniref:Lipoprotein n=1 Tax=Zestomonas insulae TaxID=2809017 RepID=A0ABS2IKI5_9GAMM|nr:hypothetical protein [Pseudomonas insulae]MBM7062480.1 hypothetical protein [Pseudomonas insulae]
MNKLFIGLLAAALLNLTGCISYSQHQLAEVQQWPPGEPPAQKRSAYLKVESQYLLNGNPQAGGFNSSNLEKLLMSNYQSSERFARVTTAQETSDLYVDVTVRNHERGSMPLAFISGFTLMVIPATADNELTMETVFRDGSGKELGRIEKKETITTWMQLVLIFALPFNQSPDGVLNQLTQSTLEEAARRQLI